MCINEIDQQYEQQIKDLTDLLAKTDKNDGENAFAIKAVIAKMEQIEKDFPEFKDDFISWLHINVIVHPIAKGFNKNAPIDGTSEFYHEVIRTKASEIANIVLLANKNDKPNTNDNND